MQQNDLDFILRMSVSQWRSENIYVSSFSIKWSSACSRKMSKENRKRNVNEYYNALVEKMKNKVGPNSLYTAH